VIDSRDGTVPYDLPLKEVLGDLPQKTFEDTRVKNQHTPLQLPADLTSQAALDRVLRLLSVRHAHYYYCYYNAGTAMLTAI
jgi:phosphoribosylformylglycinamidine synthase